MSKSNNNWFNKRYLRSIDNLHLWNGNPRLNPDDTHTTLADFVNDITEEPGDRDNFIDLVKSIVANGFIQADPIVIWQDEKSKNFYVAEGNRRVLALKLLREPLKAPKSIRSTIVQCSNTWERVDKIYVNIAPSFEDAEWYISQRNSTSSIQKRWSRLQQMRWIESLYEKYGDNEESLSRKANMTIGEIEPLVRTIKLLNLVREKEVKEALSVQEFEAATSHNFPMTILERFFNITKVRNKWGIEFDGPTISFKNRAGFLSAFVQVIRGIVNSDADVKIDTRTVSADSIDDLLKKLPQVDLTVDDHYSVGEKLDSNAKEPSESGESKSKPSDLKGDLNRNHLIPKFYKLNTSNARLSMMFSELQRLSDNSYKSVCAAALRVFLDLSVLDYIRAENLEAPMKAYFHSDLRSIILKSRLDYLSQNSKLKNNKDAVKVLKGLINDKEQYSLDILNGYIHSNKTEYLIKQYINGFWEHILPLLQAILDIKELPVV